MGLSWNFDIFFFFQWRKENAFTHAVWDSPKHYPLNSKFPCFLARQWPRNRVSITSGSLSIGAISRTSASSCFACLDSNRGFLEASYSELLPAKARTSWFPGCDRPGASPLWRCRGSTTSSLCRSLQCVPPHTAFPAAPAAIWPPAVSRYVAKAKAAVTSLDLRLPAMSSASTVGSMSRISTSTVGTRCRTDPAAPIASRKAESKLTLCFTLHFSSTRRSFVLDSLITPTFAANSSGFTRLFRFLRIAA